MTRYGALLRFKEGVSRATAERILRELAPMVEMPMRLVEGNGFKAGAFPVFEEATDGATLLHSYNDEHGGPVWYIP